MNINEDDFVTLNSGGPIMKVILIDHDIAVCKWLDKNEEEEGIFLLETLKQYN